MTTQQVREPSAADQVAEIAERQIESIRLLLCPEECDVTLGDNGTLDTVLCLDGDTVTIVVSQDSATAYRDDETGELDLEDIVSDRWDEIREEAYERFCEHGLSFDYHLSENGEPGYWCYLISTGGPGTEIRFYAGPDYRLHTAEFWFLPWFDGACVSIAGDATVQELWEQFSETETAQHVFEQATEGDY